MTDAGLDSKFLFRLTGDLGPSQQFGTKILAPFEGGEIVGPAIEGRILPGGGDWLTTRPKGISELDVRITIKTNDGALVYMFGAGRRVLDPALAATLTTFEDWAALDASSYYLRLLPTFETAEQRYEKLNGIVAVGIGRFTAAGVAFDLYEIL